VLKKLCMGAAFAVALSSVERASAADQSCTTLNRTNLMPCAARASLERKAAESAIEAARGRVEAADPWLPSSPALEGTASRRRGAEGTDFNWSAKLGVELELAGQRGARRAAGAAERNAEESRLAGLVRDRSAAAFQAYFSALAAHERATLLAKLEADATRVLGAVSAAAERGAAAGIEADLAAAGHARLVKRRVAAERDERLALASLAFLVGLRDAARPAVEGSLTPLAAAGSTRPEQPIPSTPEVLVLEAEQRASTARASSLRRSRVPNPTLSVFVARDGFDEQVAGLGLSLPLPLPEPLGRMHAGEIREQEALAMRATALAEHTRRVSRLDYTRALERYLAARTTLEAFSAERLEHASVGLRDLGSEVQAGRIPVREAVLLQEPLLELLLDAVDAKLELCAASVEVVRAAGLPFEGGSR
jgi:cobalt-zinc-cadmium efflux system outer membrane protein